MADNADRIVSVDSTDIFRHRSRSFTVDDLRIPMGVDWTGLIWGLIAGATVATTSCLLIHALGFSWWWFGLLLGLAAAASVYKLVVRQQGGLSPAERLSLRIDYLRQPAVLHGIGNDRYPTLLHWQALLYRPHDIPDYDDAFPPPAEYGIQEV